MQTRAPSSDMSVSSLSSHSFQAATPTSLLYIGVPDIEQASCVLCWGVLLHASAAGQAPGMFQGSAPAPSPPEAISFPTSPPPTPPFLQSTQPAECSSPCAFSGSALLTGGGITCFLVSPPSTLRVLGLISFCALSIQRKAWYLIDDR